MKAAKLVSLADLKRVKKEIDKQASERVAAELARIALAKKLREEKEIFATAIGKVKPLPHKGKTHLPYDPPAPIPAQQQRDEKRRLRETMSDEWDTSSLLDADESMSFRRPGIGADVVRKLRKGEWALQGQIDLHNLRSDEAREALGSFIRETYQKRPALRARSARQRPGLPRKGACAEEQSAQLVDSKKPGTGLCAGHARAGRRGGAGGAAAGAWGAVSNG